MEPSATTSTWGEWLMQRAAFVGLPDAWSLAQQIGCAVGMVELLSRLNAPPHQLRGHVAAKLAKALRIKKQMILTGWRDTEPAHASTLEARRRVAAQLERKSTAEGTARLEHRHAGRS
jgi:hypothetical protein